MGEMLQPFTTWFNRALRIDCRPDRLTGDPGAVLLREILERSGIVGWMAARLKDPRSQVDVTHDLAALIRTCVVLQARAGGITMMLTLCATIQRCDLQQVPRRD